MSATTPSRSGIVAVVGRPNVGKSTLVNALVGEKVAIVSAAPQTTRHGIRAIWHTPGAQVVFTDTPGVHKPRTPLGSRLNEVAGGAAEGVDVLIQVVDAAAGVGRGDAYVAEHRVRPADADARFCVVNKIDLVNRGKLPPQLVAADELGEWDEIVPVSAATGEGLGVLRDLLLARMPEGPPLYPDGEVTDQTTETRIAELIREQALAMAREEVPHSVAVTIDEMETEGDLTRIHGSIVVERDSQKGILIGKGGVTLKGIGTVAREQIETLLGTRVYLDLHVKVLKDWQRDPKALDRLGY